MSITEYILTVEFYTIKARDFVYCFKKGSDPFDIFNRKLICWIRLFGIIAMFL